MIRLFFASVALACACYAEQFEVATVKPSEPNPKVRVFYNMTGGPERPTRNV